MFKIFFNVRQNVLRMLLSKQIKARNKYLVGTLSPVRKFGAESRCFEFEKPCVSLVNEN